MNTDFASFLGPPGLTKVRRLYLSPYPTMSDATTNIYPSDAKRILMAMLPALNEEDSNDWAFKMVSISFVVL